MDMTTITAAPVTVQLTCIYRLAEDAHRALALAGTPTSIVQTVVITVDAREAIDRGLAYVGDDGSISQCCSGGTCRDGLIDHVNVLSDGRARYRTSRRTLECDHVLTADEAVALYSEAYACSVREDEAKRAADAAANEAKRAELAQAQARLMESISATMPLLERGDDARFDSGFPYWYEVGGVHIRLRDRSDGAEAPKEICERVREIRTAREKAVELQRSAAAERAIAERDAWIALHGSDRLKKGSLAGMLDSMVGVYRSERISIDLGPEWKSYDAVSEDEDNERRNPRESELDALLEVRNRWPDESLSLQLRSVRKSADKNDCDSTPGKWRPALMVRLPWEIDKWAVRFLDEDARVEATRGAP